MNRYIQFSNNTVASSSALRIRSIPYLTLLGDGTLTMENNAMMVDEYKNEMANLLFQLHQYYSDQQSTGHQECQLAIEILWTTRGVERQPFKARIEIFVIVRAIGSGKETVDKELDTLKEFCQASLQMQWFETEACSMDEVADAFDGVSKEKVRAVVKEERMEPLPFRQLPECHAYDVIPHTRSDLHKLTSTLVSYPNSAVSFQLLPTTFSVEEQNLLLQSAQVLTTLSTGIRDQQAGQLSILSAEKLAKLYTYYAGQVGRPLFRYNMVVWGKEEAVTALSSRVVGQLNSDNSLQRVNTTFIDLDAGRLYATQDYLHSLPWIINSTVMKNDRRFRLFHNSSKPNACQSRLAMTVSLEECMEVFTIPFANAKIAAGLQVNETGRKSRTYTDGIINGGDMTLGRLRNFSGDEIGIFLKDLAKHMLIVGTPGSGKTTFSVGLLDRLWNEHQIPFLVIEPAKNEYRALIKSIPDLQVFTPGKNDISPFLFNPFVPPKNVRLEAYKSVLKTAFSAAFNMFSPLDRIFEETVNNCYSDFRWLDSYTTDNAGRIFSIADFMDCFQNTFDKLGYKGDMQNVAKSGIVRLRSLERLFDNYHSIPIEDIMTHPTVIELSAIENSEQKALYIALLLLSILSFVNANYVGKGDKLNNFILLEEAHVLLDNTSEDSKDSKNTSSESAQGLIKRMLAEIRSYGVGLAIADQSPRKVGTDIVALTDIKVAFRLVEAQDKQIVAGSTGMDDSQIARLAKLKPGEAYLFFNKLEESEEIITPDYRKGKGIAISLSDEEISKCSKYWKDKQEMLRPYPQCSQTPYCQHSCEYHRRLLAREVARRIFNNKFSSEKAGMKTIFDVLSRLSGLIAEELNDECLTEKLKSCVKVHLFRKIQYETKIKIGSKTIEKSLKK